MRVIITGAAGRIGSQIAAELTESHELCLVDRRQMAAKNAIIADLSSRPVTNGWRSWFKTKSWRWSDAFEKAEVVIHLAANIQSVAPWEKVLPDNIQATNLLGRRTAAHSVARRRGHAQPNPALRRGRSHRFSRRLWGLCSVNGPL